MRISSLHCLFGTTALMLVGFGQASFADDALSARSKSIVREFYTTVLINRDVDAAPRFLRPDYIQHNPNVPTGLNGFMDTFRARFAQPLPADYKRELLNIVAENDLVVVYVRQTWTSRDGKTQQAPGYEMVGVQDGKIAENWEEEE